VGPDAGKNIRNALIIVALAAVVWLVPGGSAGSSALGNLLSVLLIGGLCFFAYRMYMERRVTLMDMEDRTRVILYGSFALVAFAIVATGRLTGSGPGALLWILLVGLAIYGFFFVYRSVREY